MQRTIFALGAVFKISGDTSRGLACLINMTVSIPSKPASMFKHFISCSLLSLSCTLANGCFVAIGDPEPELVDEEYPEPSRCERLRRGCLMRAGSDSKFQETCHESYRACIQQPGEPSQPSFPNDEEPVQSPQEPSNNIHDPLWNQRCQTIESSCLSSAGTSEDKEACEDFGDDCAGTDCGDAIQCSAHQTSPELLECWSDYLVCNDKARDEDEIASCGTVFRLCGQDIPGFEALKDQDNEDVLDCLTSELRCQNVVKGQTELEQSCRTVFRFCLVN